MDFTQHSLAVGDYYHVLHHFTILLSTSVVGRDAAVTASGGVGSWSHPLPSVLRMLSSPSKECRLTDPRGLLTGKAVLESSEQMDSNRSVLSTLQSTLM